MPMTVIMHQLMKTLFFATAFGFIVRAAPICSNWTEKIWDVIIVGAGPAGIIVADRMSEAGLSTLLIEAGGPSFGITGGDLDSRRPSWLNGTDLTRVDVPGLYKSIFADGGNLTCGKSLNAYGGCTIGGSSAINAGMYFVPPASDFELYFPDGWKAEDMKPALGRLLERNIPTNITSQDGIRYLQSGYDAARKWIVNGLGFAEMDLTAQPDYKTEVFGHPVYDYTNGQRGGPVVTYLQSALRRENFDLQMNTRVVRVDRERSRATGVIISLNGVELAVKLSEAGRVILSGGALFSPSLLMYSGIGSPDVLSTLRDARKLSPALSNRDWINSTYIGAGLFDNPNTFIELESDTVESYTYSYVQPPLDDRQLYIQQRSGPYTFASQTAVFWDATTHQNGAVVGFQGTVDSSGFGEYMSSKTITLNVYGTSGLKSRGHVVLDHNFIPGPSGDVYYSDPAGQDAKYIADFIYKIFQRLPGSGLTSLNIPQNSTKADIEKYITAWSTYARGQVNHWSSSCEIGKCVDVNTKVIGMENLHVVDSSIVPPLTVNPQLGIMAVAERASEMILRLAGKSMSVH
ncbi:cellobiose dehydrogenase-like protein [Calycina marina]|uniref:Cellobiose dehydrogenase-like protein n=1 Tax=Calycina marina TaxID=1763456 RepID=A0A9P7Z4C4_9HELO|nr:cellobiose dehydrogenase-like protein [Calycina marina]